MKISVCIPAYKALPLLTQTLESLKVQTFSDWELIVVEDGSNDGTEKVVGGFSKSVSQPVIYHRHAINQGLPATRNTGLGIASGEVIAFLDADDLWLPDHLSGCLEALERDNADIAFSGCVIFDSETGRTLQHRTPSSAMLESIPACLFRGEMIIQPSSVIIRRTAQRAIGDFDPRFPICNDLDYWLRACQLQLSFAFSGSESLKYRKHPGAMSKNSAALVSETAEVCRANYDLEEIPRATRVNVIVSHYRNAARMNRSDKPLLALNQILRSFSFYGISVFR